MSFKNRVKPRIFLECISQEGWHWGVELTQENVEYNVGGIIKREICMISKKISLCSLFPLYKGEAASVCLVRLSP